MTTDEWKEKAEEAWGKMNHCSGSGTDDCEIFAQALAEAYRKGVNDSANICDESGEDSCEWECGHDLARAIRKLSKEE